MIRHELLEEFRTSTRERIDVITNAWLALEKNKDDTDTSAELMRSLHSLKGESKMLGFPELSQAAHRTETLALEAVGGHIAFDERVGDLMLAAADTIMALLDATPSSREARTLVNELAVRIDALLVEAQPSPDSRADANPLAPLDPIAKETKKDASGETLRVSSNQFAVLTDLASESVIAHESYLQEARRLQERVLHATELSIQAGRSADALGALQALLADVEREALDHYYSVYDGSLQSRELEYVARQLRLVPILGLLQKHMRATRDLARELGKDVVVEVNDRDTVIDKTVADRLAEPLLHLVRNSVDHGIESPEVRRSRGKTDHGVLTLTASQDGRWVLLSVADDGGGVDRNAVQKRAIERGLVSASATLSDDEVLALLFRAGFSTREVVSETSGRGVGLDVVKSQVEAVGGHVRISSELGQGTRIDLRVPSSIALARVLVIELDDELYALPGSAVEGVIEVEPDKISVIRERPMVRFRDRHVPLVPLGPMFGLTGTVTRRAVIVGDENNVVALGVPGWRGDVEVVVKPVGSFLKSLRLVTGACVLGESEVAPMLNPVELVSLATGMTTTTDVVTKPTIIEETTKHILLVEDSSITRTMIARILRALGYEVVEAPDGEAAATILSRRAVDLVLTDIDMPRMDGIRLVQHIRAKKAWKRLPIVVLSTRGSAEDQRRALDAGADAYLVKTDFSEEVLRDLINSKLG
ncbi:MAG: response regulator [Clostridia bacterium]|nr:response regulator [Deltaproteobacteria bacterium]